MMTRLTVCCPQRNERLRTLPRYLRQVQQCSRQTYDCVIQVQICNSVVHVQAPPPLQTNSRQRHHAALGATCSQAEPPYCEPLKQLRSMARLAVQSHLYMTHAVCPHLLSWQLDFGVDAEAVSSVWRIQVCYNSDIRPVSTSCFL